MKDFSDIFYPPHWRSGHFTLNPGSFEIRKDTNSSPPTESVESIPNDPNKLGVYGKQFTLAYSFSSTDDTIMVNEPEGYGYTRSQRGYGYRSERKNVPLDQFIGMQTEINAMYGAYGLTFGGALMTEDINKIWKDFDYVWIHNNAEQVKALFESPLGDKTTYIVIGSPSNYRGDTINIIIKMKEGKKEVYEWIAHEKVQGYSGSKYETMFKTSKRGGVASPADLATRFRQQFERISPDVNNTKLPKWLPTVLPKVVAEAQIAELEQFIEKQQLFDAGSKHGGTGMGNDVGNTLSNTKVRKLDPQDWTYEKIIGLMSEIKDWASASLQGTYDFDKNATLEGSQDTKVDDYVKDVLILTNGGPANLQGRLGAQSRLLFAWEEDDAMKWLMEERPKGKRIYRKAEKNGELMDLFHKTFLAKIMKGVDDKVLRNQLSMVKDNEYDLSRHFNDNSEVSNYGDEYHFNDRWHFGESFFPGHRRQGGMQHDTVADLKPKLKERGLKVSGKKADLIERLKVKMKEEYTSIDLSPVQPQMEKIRFGNWHSAFIPTRLK